MLFRSLVVRLALGQRDLFWVWTIFQEYPPPFKTQGRRDVIYPAGTFCHLCSSTTGGKPYGPVDGKGTLMLIDSLSVVGQQLALSGKDQIDGTAHLQ